METETTHKEIFSAIQEVLETVNTFATHVDSDLFVIKERLDKIDSKVETLDKRVVTLDKDVNHIKNTMVTKDYLDDKLADQKGEIVELIRAEDHKVVMLVEELQHTKVVSAPAAKKILGLKTFAR